MWALRFFSEVGPDGSLLWLLWWVLGFLFVVIIVGWLSSRNNGSGSEVKHEASEHAQKDVDDPVKGETKSPKLKGKRRK